jgi:hypothetical protein
MRSTTSSGRCQTGAEGTDHVRFAVNEWDGMESAKGPGRTCIFSGRFIIDFPGNFRPPAQVNNERCRIVNCIGREMNRPREVLRKDRVDIASKMRFLKLKILLLSESSDERRQTNLEKSSSPLPI